MRFLNTLEIFGPPKETFDRHKKEAAIRARFFLHIWNNDVRVYDLPQMTIDVLNRPMV